MTRLNLLRSALLIFSGLLILVVVGVATAMMPTTTGDRDERSRPPPAHGVQLMRIGNPKWKPVDFHLFSAPIGTAPAYAEFLQTAKGEGVRSCFLHGRGVVLAHGPAATHRIPGALYHLTSRGNTQEDIFRDDADRLAGRCGRALRMAALRLLPDGQPLSPEQAFLRRWRPSSSPRPRPRRSPKPNAMPSVRALSRPSAGSNRSCTGARPAHRHLAPEARVYPGADRPTSGAALRNREPHR
jgi:hypothetical protein